jgi:CheY-like chemotaxis protein
MDALQVLRREHWDVLILDLMLPSLDGVTLLETVAEEGICPMVLTVTSYVSEYVMTVAQRLGIGYIIRKPCSISAVTTRVLDLNKHLLCRRQNPRSYVVKILLSLGLAPDHAGFTYLVEAILIWADNPRIAITKELYPAIVKRCGVITSNIERPCRTAIETAWEIRDPQLWQTYFPHADDRPNNKRFIATMAQALQEYLDNFSME